MVKDGLMAIEIMKGGINMENLIILYATGIIAAGAFYFWMAHTKSGRKWLREL